METSWPNKWQIVLINLFFSLPCTNHWVQWSAKCCFRSHVRVLPLFLHCNFSITNNARIINWACYYSLMRYIYWRQRQKTKKKKEIGHAGAWARERKRDNLAYDEWVVNAERAAKNNVEFIRRKYFVSLKYNFLINIFRTLERSHCFKKQLS